MQHDAENNCIMSKSVTVADPLTLGPDGWWVIELENSAGDTVEMKTSYTCLWTCKFCLITLEFKLICGKAVEFRAETIEEIISLIFYFYI